MTHMEEYRERLFPLAHNITGEFMACGKIKSYDVRDIANGKGYTIRFSDNGHILYVNIYVAEE